MTAMAAIHQLHSMQTDQDSCPGLTTAKTISTSNCSGSALTCLSPLQHMMTVLEIFMAQSNSSLSNPMTSLCSTVPTCVLIKSKDMVIHIRKYNPMPSPIFLSLKSLKHPQLSFSPLPSYSDISGQQVFLASSTLQPNSECHHKDNF